MGRLPASLVRDPRARKARLRREWSFPHLFAATQGGTMFLPLGDDVDTRTLPFVGLALVGINVLVFCAMVGMAVDYAPPKSKPALRASKTPKARKAPKASKVENAS